MPAYGVYDYTHKSYLSIMKTAEIFFKDGCGRCKLMSTPACKVQQWKNELAALRKIVETTELIEELKWGMPTYTLGKANILMIAAFKQYCSLSFFKGALLTDPDQLLTSPGENSQSAKQFRFTDLTQIKKYEKQIKAFIAEAIKNEKAGLKPAFTKSKVLELSPEFQEKLDKNAKLKKAFDALTPGRQRSHHLYISSAKQAKTREDRVERCVPVILEGKGWNEY